MPSMLPLDQIDPRRARELLARAVAQPIDAEKVRRYAALMTAGQWRQGEGEPLIVQRCGRVGNGLHRLHAVLLSGTTIFLPVDDWRTR